MKPEEVKNKVEALLEELANDAYNGRPLQAYFAVRNITKEWIKSKERDVTIV